MLAEQVDRFLLSPSAMGASELGNGDLLVCDRRGHFVCAVGVLGGVRGRNAAHHSHQRSHALHLCLFEAVHKAHRCLQGQYSICFLLLDILIGDVSDAKFHNLEESCNESRF